VSEPPRRVRVTADSRTYRPAARGPATRGIALPGAPVDEADAVYARALRTSQLRLALGTLAGFLLVVAALTGVVVLVPDLDRIVIAGVPASWLLHAFAFYPLIFVFAALYARGASRNEQRYRDLRERE